MGVKTMLSFMSKKKQQSVQNEARLTQSTSNSSLPSTSTSSTSLNSASLTSISRRVLVWQRGNRRRGDHFNLGEQNTTNSSSLSLDSDASETGVWRVQETSVPRSKVQSQPPTYESQFPSSPAPPPSPHLGISPEGRESIRARMEGRRGVRRGSLLNEATRATDLGIAIRYGDTPPSLEIQNAAMPTDAYTGASELAAELPPAYVARTPCLPTYDIVMSMRRRQSSAGRSSSTNRQSSLPVWFDSIYRQRRRNEEAVTRRRELGRVEAMIRQERQRPMRERENSHERRVQQQQARLDMGSPLGAFRGNEALGLDLNDRDMDVLLRAFGVPAY